MEFFYSTDKNLRQKMNEQKKSREKYVSSVVIHEVYKLTLEKEDEKTLRLRTALMKKDFQVVAVNEQIAQVSAEMRHKYNLSMGDSMIAATASMLKAVCITDDPHFKQIKEIQTTWI